jgi:hypothetical protein
LQVTVPNASTISRSLTLLVAVLGLQITSSHVAPGFHRFGGILLPKLQIKFIDDLKRETFEYGLFEVFIKDMRMVGGDQFHLSR